MYLEHFKLSDKPFNNCPNDGFFTPNDEFESAVERMQQVLLSRDAVAIITGGPGVGKTTLVSTAARRLKDKATVAYIDMRLTDPDLLFDLLLLNLGEEGGAGDQATSLYRLKTVISRHNDEQGRKITAVIDVSSLTIERAKRILQLVHMTGEPEGQLNVVLIGPHVLHKLLDTPGLIHMRQRVTFRYRARPLTIAETGAYLEAQLEHSGGQPESILQHGTSIMAYRYVGGVPRLINTLMDAAMSYAAAKDSATISPDMITEVAKMLGWRRLSGSKSAKAAIGTASPEQTRPRQKKPAAPVSTAVKEPEECSPLELLATESTPDTAKTSAPAATPSDEGTAMLMAAALDADTISEFTKPKPDNDSVQSESPKADSPQADDNPQPTTSGVPAMDASDTSATGMLRLEDLDARFAETVFGDDTGMFKVDGDLEKAAGEKVSG